MYLLVKNIKIPKYVSTCGSPIFKMPETIIKRNVTWRDVLGCNGTHFETTVLPWLKKVWNFHCIFLTLSLRMLDHTLFLSTPRSLIFLTKKFYHNLPRTQSWYLYLMVVAVTLTVKAVWFYTLSLEWLFKSIIRKVDLCWQIIRNLMCKVFVF